MKELSELIFYYCRAFFLQKIIVIFNLIVFTVFLIFRAWVPFDVWTYKHPLLSMISFPLAIVVAMGLPLLIFKIYTKIKISPTKDLFALGGLVIFDLISLYAVFSGFEMLKKIM
jgi:hypothetical protein